MNSLEAQKFADTHLCAVCGNCPSIYPDDRIGQLDGQGQVACGYIVRCQNPAHEGFTRISGYMEAWRKGTPIPIHIANNIERKEKQQMTQQLGEATTTALEPYIGVTSLTQKQAAFILRTIWPQAPEVEVIKAALICHMYALNPLMKHLYLVPFRGEKTTTWAPIMGIGATRLIASRVDRYSYVAGPRMMTEQEQKEIRLEVDPDNIWAITVLQDSKGNSAPGYGSWPKHAIPYGSDKGNSKENMAMIRSERQAFDRLFPGEMPQEIEVIDTQYLDTKPPKPDTKAANEQGTFLITQAQVNKLWSEARRREYTTEQVHQAISHRYDTGSVKDLTRAQASDLIDALVKGQDILEGITEAEPGQTELPL